MKPINDRKRYEVWVRVKDPQGNTLREVAPRYKQKQLVYRDKGGGCKIRWAGDWRRVEFDFQQEPDRVYVSVQEVPLMTFSALLGGQ